MSLSAASNPSTAMMNLPHLGVACVTLVLLRVPCLGPALLPFGAPLCDPLVEEEFVDGPVVVPDRHLLLCVEPVTVVVTRVQTCRHLGHVGEVLSEDGTNVSVAPVLEELRQGGGDPR